MMKLNTPQNSGPAFALSQGKIFYVSSESKPDESHMVVFFELTNVAICDCRDYFARRLPLLGSYRYPGSCKHGQFVQDVTRLGKQHSNLRITSAERI